MWCRSLIDSAGQDSQCSSVRKTRKVTIPGSEAAYRLAHQLEAIILTPTPINPSLCLASGRVTPERRAGPEEYIGLTEIDGGEWDVYFGPLRLGRFHEPTLTIEDALGGQYRRHY
jgi:hypothetical protein